MTFFCVISVLFWNVIYFFPLFSYCPLLPRDMEQQQQEQQQSDTPLWVTLISENRTDELLQVMNNRSFDVNFELYEDIGTTWNPLSWAVYCDNGDIVTLLFKRGADPYMKIFFEGQYFSLIALATFLEKQNASDAFLDHPDLDQLVAYSEDQERIREFQKSDPTPVWVRVISAGDQEGLRVILEDPSFNLNKRWREVADGGLNYWTPLSYATMYSSTIVSTLLRRGADISVKSYCSGLFCTAEEIAAEYTNLDSLIVIREFSETSQSTGGSSEHREQRFNIDQVIVEGEYLAIREAITTPGYWDRRTATLRILSYDSSGVPKRQWDLAASRHRVLVKLQSHGLLLQLVRADVSSQFRAVAFKVLGTENEHNRLRYAVARELQVPNNVYRQMWERVHPDASADWDFYVSRIIRQLSFGDHLTLMVMADLLNVDFHLHTEATRFEIIGLKRSSDSERIFAVDLAVYADDYYDAIVVPLSLRQDIPPAVLVKGWVNRINTLFDDTVAQSGDDIIRAWWHSSKDTFTRAQFDHLRDPITRIAIMGVKRCGKSTLINSILEGDFLPALGGDVVTSCIVELSHIDQNDYTVVTNLLSKKDWEVKVKEMIENWMTPVELHVGLEEEQGATFDARAEREDTNRRENLRKSAMAFFKSVYPNCFKSMSQKRKGATAADIFQMLEAHRDEEHKRILDRLKLHGEVLVHSTPDQVRSYLRSLMSNIWFLLDTVEVKGRFRNIPPGVVILDVPGFGDSNTYRGEAVARLMESSKNRAPDVVLFAVGDLDEEPLERFVKLVFGENSAFAARERRSRIPTMGFLITKCDNDSQAQMCGEIESEYFRDEERLPAYWYDQKHRSDLMAVFKSMMEDRLRRKVARIYERAADLPIFSVSAREFMDLRHGRTPNWARNEEETGIPQLLRFMGRGPREVFASIQRIWLDLPHILLDLFEGVIGADFSEDLRTSLQDFQGRSLTERDHFLPELKKSLQAKAKPVKDAIGRAKLRATSQVAAAMRAKYKGWHYQALGAMLRRKGVYSKDCNIPQEALAILQAQNLSQLWADFFSPNGVLSSSWRGYQRELIDRDVRAMLAAWLGASTIPDAARQQLAQRINEILGAEFRRLDTALQNVRSQLTQFGSRKFQNAEVQLRDEVSGKMAACLECGCGARDATIANIANAAQGAVRSLGFTGLPAAVDEAANDIYLQYQTFFTQVQNAFAVLAMETAGPRFEGIKTLICHILVLLTGLSVEGLLSENRDVQRAAINRIRQLLREREQRRSNISAAGSGGSGRPSGRPSGGPGAGSGSGRHPPPNGGGGGGSGGNNNNLPRSPMASALEWEAVDRFIAEHLPGAVRVPLPRKGFCLFQAVALGLAEHGHELVRHHVAEWLRQNNEWDPEEGKTREEYIKHIAESDAWGGEPELMAMAAIYQVTIVVIRPNGNGGVTMIRYPHDGQNREVYLAYNSVNHYDAIVWRF
jgi:hypothetical protein